MTKHKLDLVTEDILQHYGVKGMRWDVIRTREEIDAADAAAGAGEASELEAREEFPELWDLMDKGKALLAKVDEFTEKIEDVGETLNKHVEKGKSLFAKLSRKVDNAIFTPKEFKQEVNKGFKAKQVQKHYEEKKRVNDKKIADIQYQRDSRARNMRAEAIAKGYEVRDGTRRKPR